MNNDYIRTVHTWYNMHGFQILEYELIKKMSTAGFSTFCFTSFQHLKGLTLIHICM